MRILPEIWVIVGALVTLVSWIIGPNLVIFFYVGLAFMVWGVFRIILKYTMREAPRTERKITHVCYNCKKEVSQHSRVCPHCHARLR